MHTIAECLYLDSIRFTTNRKVWISESETVAKYVKYVLSAIMVLKVIKTNTYFKVLSYKCQKCDSNEFD